MADADLQVVVTAVDRATRQIRNVGDSVDRLSTRAQRASRGLETFTRGVSRVATVLAAAGVGIGLVASFRAATRAAAEFERGLTGVAKTTGIEGEALERLGGQLSELATRIPTTTNELAALAQSAGQLGVQGEDNILKFTETIAQLGFAANITGEEAAQAFARILNVTGENIGTVDRLASVVVDLGNNFATTEQEITRTTNEITRAVATFDIGSTRAAAFAAALSSIGARAEISGTALGRVFRGVTSAVSEGGGALDQFARIAQSSSEAFAEAFSEDKTEAVIQFIEGLGQLNATEQIAALDQVGLKSEDINKVIVPLANNVELLRDSLNRANTAFEENSALATEAERAFETFEARSRLLGNAFEALLRQVGTGFLGELGEAVDNLADALISGDFQRAAREFGESLGSAIRFLIDSFDTLVTVVQTLGIALGSLALGRVAAGAVALGSSLTSAAAGFSAATTAAGGLRIALAALGGPVGLIAALVTALFLFTREEDEATEATNTLRESNERLQEVLKDTSASDAAIESAADKAQADLDAARAALIRARAEQARQDATATEFGIVGASSPLARNIDALQTEVDRLEGTLDRAREKVSLAFQPPDDGTRAGQAMADFSNAVADTGDQAAQTASDLDQLAASARLIADQSTAGIEQLQAQLEAGEISTESFYARRLQLQQQSLDAELAVLNQQLSTTKDANEQLAIETDIELKQRQRARLQEQTARDLAAAQQELTDSLVEVQNRFNEATNASLTLEQRQAQVRQGFSELLDQLEAEGRTRDIQLVENLIDVEAARQSFSAVLREAQTFQNQLRADVELIKAQEEAGQLGAVQAADQIEAARARTKAQLEELLPLLRERNRLLEDPALAAQITQLEARIVQLGTDTSSVFSDLGNVLEDSVGNALSTIGQRAQSLRDVIRDITLSILQSLQRLAAQKLATQLVGSIGLAAAQGGYIKGFPTGGVVRGPGTSMSDSIPARLSDGEYVVRASSVRHYGPHLLEALNRRILPKDLLSSNRFKGLSLSRGRSFGFAEGGLATDPDARTKENGSGNKGQNVRIINVIDEQAIANAMSSAAGERVIKNTIGKNPETVRRAVG